MSLSFLVVIVTLTLVLTSAVAAAEASPLSEYTTFAVAGDFAFLANDSTGVVPGAFGGLIGFDLETSRWSTIGGGFPFIDCDGTPVGNEVFDLIPVHSGDLDGLVVSDPSLLVAGYIGNTSTNELIAGAGVWDAARGKWIVLGTPGYTPRNGASTLTLTADRAAFAVTGYFSEVDGVEVAVSAAVWMDGKYWPMAAADSGLSCGGIIDYISGFCTLGKNESQPMRLTMSSLAWAAGGHSRTLVYSGNARLVPGVGNLEDAGFLPFAAAVKFSAAGSQWQGLVPKGEANVTGSTFGCQNFSGKDLPLSPVDNGDCNALMHNSSFKAPTGACCSFVTPPVAYAEYCIQEYGGGDLTALPLPGTLNGFLLTGAAHINGEYATLAIGDDLVPLPALPDGVPYLSADIIPVRSDVSDEVIGIMALWLASDGARAFAFLDVSQRAWSRVYTTAPGELSIFALTTVRLLPRTNTIVASGIRDADHQDGPQGIILMYSEPIDMSASTAPPVVGAWLDTPFSTLRASSQLVYASNGFVPRFVLSHTALLDAHIPPFCGKPPPSV
ncbi:uncharacterized protein AMSG_04532 [Thecamonas trahens ATCC 50062]|uniref:Uncharacterized protein n=1 Tax=Thecamonas trahens ATCC 50062 TaxID=461836 RepID=A0A0L0D899_THETB|nr:hypothetical protein AMSG_04532 [Thecamonas trahens ATCC 50062]KNC48301.1 hypothetical protein AMSG_04532 [Thecamonas trahens ATCC 50062]|eukprot:XP_013758868.1 hypothetical protein AMSG_04532 [Thecamonas trahens ATCC 50062]